MRFDIDAIEGIPLLGLKYSLTSTWCQMRTVDIVEPRLDVIGAPSAAIALAIKLDPPGPVLTTQQRIRKDCGKRFGLPKFR